MSKVFVVTHGSYSDFHTVAIFSTRELAQNYIDESKKRDGYSDINEDIEEYELDEPINYESYTEVEMLQNGDTKRTKTFKPMEVDAQCGFGGFSYDKKSFFWAISTDDKDKAVKVANEKRSQILALGLWGNDREVRERVT